jgi:hypothetical protein
MGLSGLDGKMESQSDTPTKVFWKYLRTAGRSAGDAGFPIQMRLLGFMRN